MKHFYLALMFVAFAPQYSLADSGTLLGLPGNFSKKVSEEIAAQKNLLSNETPTPTDQPSSLSQIQLKTFAQVGFNVLFFEVKVKPSVELRWTRADE